MLSVLVSLAHGAECLTLVGLVQRRCSALRRVTFVCLGVAEADFGLCGNRADAGRDDGYGDTGHVDSLPPNTGRADAGRRNRDAMLTCGFRLVLARFLSLDCGIFCLLFNGCSACFSAEFTEDCVRGIGELSRGTVCACSAIAGTGHCAPPPAPSYILIRRTLSEEGRVPTDCTAWRRHAAACCLSLLAIRNLGMKGCVQSTADCASATRLCIFHHLIFTSYSRLGIVPALGFPGNSLRF